MAFEHDAFPIVGIEASAGGLEARRELLRFLPADAGMAYVVVQHLDPRHESLLPELLAQATVMEVHEARAGMSSRSLSRSLSLTHQHTHGDCLVSH
jgi:two-component system, chemotaxis family, CheB/CheR fusion protein